MKALHRLGAVPFPNIVRPRGKAKGIAKPAAALSLLAGLISLTIPSAGTVPSATAADIKPGEWVSLAAGPAPASNPLQGFVPYAGKYGSLPYSMEWFYIPVNAVVTGPGNYDWSALESQLNAIAARGHQAVFRFYLDYPGKPTGVPKYLLDAGLATHSYTDYGNQGISVSPDYDDPRLAQALDGFIAAFGSKYDGDRRIGFIQAGLLGFWGEWHTYPHDGWASPENWSASATEQQLVLQAYTAAFTRTKLQVRYPTTANSSLSVGYHDDSFAAETMPGTGWSFVDKLQQAGATGKWLTQPVGGELRPELQPCLFDAVPCPWVADPAQKDFPGSVAATHASWLLNQYAFSPAYAGAAQSNAAAASQSLGYRFQATGFSLTPGTVKGQSDLSVTIRNTGAAPFYYDWPVQVAAVGGDGKIARTWTTSWRLTSIKPGMAPTLGAPLSTAGLPAGYYTLVLRPVNPLANGVPLRFANAAQDQTLPGWLTLGRNYFPAS
ncbi:DUF4832 domain-containing protein [Arthrobacter sp. NicSoilC5]|uniref:DUF4832 domain-containing protein n=1 Tax=Arthrobacter sp. NicSoilC5 TaxID=2831000 RepID=UPI001CC6D852|nr:DUF4832 domain-containing protein [Arthrobacter sp. NicSoilC5]BCW79775.1 beta-galactosidase [Arthrobacter sp. NicSoilC5]